MSEKTLFEKLIENWGNVKRNVKLAEVVDPLIQKGIVSLELWADLRNNYQSEIDRMEEFMLKIFNKDNPEAIEIFVEALRKNGYISTANSISGRSGSQCENDEHQASNDDRNPMQNNEASGHQSYTLVSSPADTVGRKDRDKLKDEITNEIVDKFMVMLTTIDAKITTGFQKQKSEFEEFKSHLMTVQELSTRLFEKERQCEELNNKTHDIEKKLIQQDAEYSKTIQTKETEKRELEKRMQEKTDAYKELQEKLTEWKKDEEERYKSLKIANNEKAEWERKYKEALEEKTATDEKYMALIKKHDENINFDSNETLISRIQELERIEKELRAKLHVLDERIAELSKENKSLEGRLQHRKENQTFTNLNTPITPRHRFNQPGNATKPQARRKPNQK